MADEVRVIIGTGVTVGAAIIGVAMWAFKAVIAKEVTPVMVELRLEAKALTREFAAYREAKDEERRETRAILKDLDAIVRNHEKQLLSHDLRLESLENPLPPAGSASRKKRAA